MYDVIRNENHPMQGEIATKQGLLKKFAMVPSSPRAPEADREAGGTIFDWIEANSDIVTDDCLLDGRGP